MNNKLISMFSLYKDIGIEFLFSKSQVDFSKDLQKETNIIAIKKEKINIESKPILKNHINIKSRLNDANALLEKIKVDLSNISSIKDLRSYLYDFKDCKLKNTALNTVLGCGNEQAKLMLIGEAPGAEEDEMGEPFVGRSGKLLMQVFKSIGIKREDMFISNTVFWRPPGNRVPDTEETNICYPFLHKLICLIKPKFIVAIGRSSASVILNTEETIGKLRGTWQISDNIKPKNGLSLPSDINLTTVYHPAYLLRSYTQKKIFWDDILKIKLKLIDTVGY